MLLQRARGPALWARPDPRMRHRARARSARRAVCDHPVVRRIAWAAVLATVGLLGGMAAGASAGRRTATLDLRSVNWAGATLPPVCGGSQPIQLHRLGSSLALIAVGYVTPIPRRWSGDAFYGRHSVQVWAGWEHPVYGQLGGDAGEVAALAFSCTNGGGTADGELLNGYVVFSGAESRLSVVGVVTARARHPPSDPVSTVAVSIGLGRITAHESWSLYEPKHPLSEVGYWATTIWTYANGNLQAGKPRVVRECTVSDILAASPRRRCRS